MATNREVEIKVVNQHLSASFDQEAEIQVWFAVTEIGGKRLAFSFPIIVSEAADLCNGLFEYFGEELLDQIEGKFINPLINDQPTADVEAEVPSLARIREYENEMNWHDRFGAGS